MKRNLIAAAAAIAILGTGGAGGAIAGAVAHEKYENEDKCMVPTAEWQSMDTLIQKLGLEGWTITEVEIDDGCYEVEGIDDQGREVEAYINPKTFEVIELEIES